MEGAAGEREAGVRRAERTRTWRGLRGKRGDAGGTTSSWQGRAEARGRAGGWGCGGRRGERGV